ncbi:MAG: methylmalonyl-CoA mutase family protein [Saprospiraceae bacterium]
MSKQFNFPVVDKTTWLRRINQDLKGKKEIEDLMRFVEGIKLDPFVTADEVSSVSLPLDRIFDRIERGIFLEISHGKEGNLILTKLLENGATALYLNIQEDVNPTDLFDGVFAEYIFLCIYLKEEKNSSLFVEYFEKRYAEKSIRTFIYCGSKTVFPPQTAIFNVKIHDQFVLPIQHFMVEAKNVILANKPLRCIVNLSIGKDFVLTICALRALRILWENLVSNLGFEGDIPMILCVKTSEEILSKDFNQSLIESSFCTMSALLGNVDVFYSNTHPSNRTIAELSKVLNIQHVFLEEGKLDLVKDPVSGSQYIENATFILAEKVWEQFQN